jgi:iron(III) transport system ATP-binding protein
MASVSFKELRKTFGAMAAVDSIDLDVADGELVCLVGPSGCGKSTLLRLAAGLETADSGEIQIAGKSMGAGSARLVPPEERNVGFVFQDYALFPHLSVRENVEFGLTKLDASARIARADEALARVRMMSHAGDYPHTLSGGEQQRVALARAMAPQPGVFLLDEPFSGLDASLRNQLAEETWHLLKQSGAATLLVTHDPEEAMLMGDRIAVMRDGALEQVGTPREVYSSPKTAFVVEFLSEANRFQYEVGGNGQVPTPFGPIESQNLPKGSKVDVLIRYHAISLDEAGATGVAATLRAVLPYGRGSHVRLEVLGEDGPVFLRGRLPRTDLPEPGTAVSMTLNPSHVFVFPAES